MGKRIAAPLLVMVGLSAAAQAQTMEIEGQVYAGVEFDCWLLDDIHTGTSFELYGGGPDLYQEGVWAIVWGSLSDGPTYCMQGIPFDVTSYSIELDCDDGNPCTDDFFSGGSCHHTPIDCDDNDPCTTDTCVAGICEHDAVDCDDGNLCTIEYCNPVSGQCEYSIIDPCCPNEGPCYDGNPCTEDWACTGDGRCAFPALPDGTPCDDSVLCTDSDICTSGICIGTPIDCDDGNPCTEDACLDGECVHTPVGGAELIVVEMPELIGMYLWNTREAEVFLGFRPFEIGCLAMDWAGGIYTSTVDCFGDLQGYGGTLTASFVPQPAPSVSFIEIGGEPFSLIPFDRLDAFPGEPPVFFADGIESVRVAFEQIIQECYIVEPARAVVDSAGLIIAARRMHDFDGDGHVNLDDAAEFVGCMDGPDGGLGFGCLIFDGEGDEDVDLMDAAAFQRAFTGP